MAIEATTTPDGLQNVAQGQDNSGSAFIIPSNNDDPQNIWRRQLDGLKLRIAQQKAQDAARQQKLAEKFGKPDEMLKGAFDIDIQREILPKVQAYKKQLQQWYSKGLNPEDPMSPVFGKDQELMNDIRLNALASSQHKAEYDKMLETLNGAEAGKYDVELSTLGLDNWRNMSLGDRSTASKPTLEKFWDMQSKMQDFMSKNAKDFATKTGYSNPDGRYIKEGTLTTFTPKQITDFSESFMSNPLNKRAMERNWEMSDKKKYPTLQSFAEDFTRTFMINQKTANTTSDPTFGEGNGIEADKAAAKWVVELFGGLAGGNPDLMNDFQFNYLNKDSQKPQITAAFSDAITGKRLGEYSYTESQGKDEKGNEKPGKIVTVPNLVKSVKWQGNELYVKDTRSENERDPATKQQKYKDGWRPFSEVGAQGIYDFILSNYGAGKAPSVQREAEKLLASYGISLDGGSVSKDQASDNIYQGSGFGEKKSTGMNSKPNTTTNTTQKRKSLYKKK
jgi:hypothetical protein